MSYKDKPQIIFGVDKTISSLKEGVSTDCPLISISQVMAKEIIYYLESQQATLDQMAEIIENDKKMHDVLVSISKGGVYSQQLYMMANLSDDNIAKKLEVLAAYEAFNNKKGDYK